MDRIVFSLFGLLFSILLMIIIGALIGSGYGYIKCSQQYPKYICLNTDYLSFKSCIKDGKTNDECFRLLTGQSLKISVDEGLE